jgi:hypothetical protein
VALEQINLAKLESNEQYFSMNQEILENEDDYHNKNICIICDEFIIGIGKRHWTDKEI